MHDDKVRNLAFARISVCVAVADARSARDAAVAEHRTKVHSLALACAAWKERAYDLKVAWNDLRSMSEDQTRADAAVVECRTQLVQFQRGPLAFVKKTISE